jgi:amino acid transporter
MSVTFDEPRAPAAEPSPTGLKRELSLIDAAAFSTGILGPVGAMALLGTGAAGILGRAAPWAFIFALVGISLVAYAFVRLSKYVSSSGSVYALVGITLGPRAGFVAGWALFGAYVTIGAGSGIEIGLFFSQFLSGVGILHTTEWIAIAIIGLGLCAALAFTEIRVITRSLLGTELIGVVLVTLLSLIVIARLVFGHGPHGQTFTFNFLSLPHGTGFGTVAHAAEYGFLAFAGFEGAVALGEETFNPAREIPRALTVTIVVVGSFYLLTIIAQSLGYGTGAAAVTAFTNASSPYGDLATAYVGSSLADLLNLAASLSLFAILLATTAGAARILYALARDAGTKRGIVRLSRHGEPIAALGIVIAIMLGVMIGQRVNGSSVLNATFYALTIGTIALLVAYLLATLGAIRFLFLGRTPRAPRWQIIVPTAGAGFVLYTIYKNVIGVSFPYNRFAYLVAAWLVIGLGIVVFSPGMADRVTARLQASREVVDDVVE